VEEPRPDDVVVLSVVEVFPERGNWRVFGCSISSAPRSPRVAATASMSSVLLPVPVVELDPGLVQLSYHYWALRKLTRQRYDPARS